MMRKGRVLGAAALVGWMVWFDFRGLISGACSISILHVGMNLTSDG